MNNFSSVSSFWEEHADFESPECLKFCIFSHVSSFGVNLALSSSFQNRKNAVKEENREKRKTKVKKHVKKRKERVGRQNKKWSVSASELFDSSTFCDHVNFCCWERRRNNNCALSHAFGVDSLLLVGTGQVTEKYSIDCWNGSLSFTLLLFVPSRLVDSLSSSWSLLSIIFSPGCFSWRSSFFPSTSSVDRRLCYSHVSRLLQQCTRRRRISN